MAIDFTFEITFHTIKASRKPVADTIPCEVMSHSRQVEPHTCAPSGEMVMDGFTINDIFCVLF